MKTKTINRGKNDEQLILIGIILHPKLYFRNILILALPEIENAET